MESSSVIEFLKIAGGLKDIERFRGQFFWKDYPQRQRYDSVADHTWRMALILILMEKRLAQPIDLIKALKMVIIHDLAEVIVGDLSPLGSDGTGKDAHSYSKEKAQEKFENEKAAAKTIFSKLSEDLAQELYDLWLEYEEQENFESKVVKAIDKIEGKLQASEYMKGHMFPAHLEFSVKYGTQTFDVDPALKELGGAVNNEIEKDYKEFIK